MTTNTSLSRLSDAQLLDEVKRLVAVEHEATADVIRSLCEVEARQLHLAIGCGSMFEYCTRVLHLSEHAAYARIAAARCAVDYPLILELLVEGAITLTTVTLLGRHLTAENHVAVLASARHKSKVDVEKIVAGLNPQPDVRASVRKLPEPKIVVAPPPPLVTAASTTASPEPATVYVPSAQAAVVRPLAPERYKLQVTINGETCAKLRRAQDLLRHTSERGNEADVIDRALTPPAIRPHAISPQACVAPSAGAMDIAARSSDRAVGAKRPPVWNTTTGFPSPTAVQPPWKTSSCAAGRTTRTRRSSGSVRCSCARDLPSGVGLV